MADHYKNLGVSRNASKKEIKDAFRKQALIHHPDKQQSNSSNSNSNEQFRKISEAYETLIDDQKRTDYNYRYRSFNNNNKSSSSSTRSRSTYSSYNSSSSSSSSYRSSPYGSSPYGSSAYRSPGLASSTRAFLRDLVFVGVLIGVAFSVGTVRDSIREKRNSIRKKRNSIWERRNSGKSHHDAIQYEYYVKQRDEKDV